MKNWGSKYLGARLLASREMATKNFIILLERFFQWMVYNCPLQLTALVFQIFSYKLSWRLPPSWIIILDHYVTSQLRLKLFKHSYITQTWRKSIWEAVVDIKSSAIVLLFLSVKQDRRNFKNKCCVTLLWRFCISVNIQDDGKTNSFDQNSSRTKQVLKKS